MKYYLLICFLIISIGIKAQESNLEIIKSKVFANEKYKTSLLFAKEDINGDIYLVRNYYKSVASPLGYFIEHYDKDLTLLKSDKVEVNRSELRGIYINDSEVILLQFKYIQKEKIYSFVTLTSNKDTFNFVEKEILSFDRDKIKRYDYFGIRKEKEFNYLKEYRFGEIVESDNNKFIAINLFVKRDNNIDRFQLTVFNDKFEKVFDHVLDKVITDNKSKAPLFNYQNIELDDNGNIYLLGKIYNTISKQEKVKGFPKYKYELFKINKQEQKQTPINNSTYFIDRLHLVIKNNNPTCIGFYKIKNYNDPKLPKKTSKKGIVRISIDRAISFKFSTLFL